MNRQSGFTLVELAVVLVIIGVMLGTSMAMMKPYIEGAKISATKEKLNKISDALALFVQNYNRLPCPAKANPTGGEPFGAPANSGTNGTSVTNKCGNGGAQNIPGDYVGIIPFRALGLAEDNVRDGYGNLITYAVAPAESGYATGAATDDYAHQNCRITDIWVPVTGMSMPYSNKNAVKAKFCCPRYISANAEIKVLDGLGSANQVFTGVHTTTGSYYANNGTSFDPPSNNFDTRMVAYVLMSHGKNGDGAYIKQSAGTNPVTANAGAQESENRNADLTFVDRPLSFTNDTNYIDDILLWRTNDQIITNFGTGTCQRP